MTRPRIVCLCGSSRFREAYEEANRAATRAGRIVLSIGCFKGEDLTPDAKAQLDVLHLAKIDMADEVLILNVGGYIGESTRREIFYALLRDKEIRYLEPTLED